MSGPKPSVLQRELHSLASAITFLTRIPLPGFQYDQQSQGRAILYFPLVGLLVALPAIAMYYFALTLWSQSVAVVLAMATTILLTGGFHEDGLADSADGLGGGWQRADKLRIMKDSRLGTYGALALVMSLLLKFTLLSSLPHELVPAALLTAHIVGRWSTLPLLYSTPYLGGSEASGTALLQDQQQTRLWLATGFSFGAILLLQSESFWLLLTVVAILLFLWRRHCLRQLGGINGDTLGAANQMVELSIYLCLAATLAP
ncbi:adenosylcobinamide-GDP ribazoletransferase [Parahaliea sp. F7430]|uniref:Adenosylcobinamide-GDP ribazoletransferase n=1 Tax=Sediminihaliea albiluteola TaxID=2758564 RepID=A0A7W2TVD6_9GAMM|nr:adenosylcobinamide-GDP ribazoletransferase [Sediminihaliea albiluteola]MBA6412637.1 adenosylcobinamide-GDP ribazoletransferase [Sediminihaliea albiluteola]